jgi:dTDP-4-amino-4,6-dideoxygalactose transaminase
MQFIDLKKQQQKIKKSIDNRISQVLEHGKYILGPEVKELEEKLADFVGVKYGIGVANGSDALIIALLALGVGAGDAVFVPSFTFFASASSIVQVGATPVFIDVDENTFNIDTNHLKVQIENTIKDGKLSCKAIISVDLFGQVAEYDKIDIIAKEYNLKVIEDAAQSLGAQSKNKKAGSFGDIATTSFFPAKPLGCYGDGGMIFTNDTNLKEIIESLRVHGKGTDKYDNVRIGKNSRLDTMQAAILLAKFELFDTEIQQRQAVAEYYNKNLKNCLDTPVILENNISAWAQYTLKTNARNKCIESLKNKNIPSAIYYPKPLHKQVAFSNLKEVKLPKTDKIIDQVFSIPFHPYLEKNDQDSIIETLLKSTKEKII